MTLLVLAAALLFAALALERVRLDRARRRVPLRIAVTGTRGKTTVARLLASVLRADGRRVLAKTTGSEPCLVLPDGSVERIRRRGPPSILEQKALLHRAALLRADAVVAEVMSIHAENHAVEGRRILVPHLVLATNFLVDHTEAQGESPEEVGTVLAQAVPAGASVLVPEGTCPASFRALVAAAGGVLDEVPRQTLEPECPWVTFPENLDLVVAAARRLGVGDGAIRGGIASAALDIGALAVWTLPGHPQPRHLVNAFAANDPEATMRVYDEVMRKLANSRAIASGPERPRCVGILSLRADRSDRSLQWADALAAGLLDRFDALVVTGLHAAALARRVQCRRARERDGSARAGAGGRASGTADPRIRALPRASAEELTRAALSELGASGGIVFGFGNIGGAGTELVESWSRAGEAVVHGL